MVNLLLVYNFLETSEGGPFCVLIDKKNYFLNGAYGSIIGGIVIAVGLYSVVWGKAKDYSEPKLPSTDAEDTESLPITATSKIDIISGNLEKQPSTDQKLEETNKVGEEKELNVVKV